MMLYKFFKTPEYIEWFEEQQNKAKVQINDRIFRIAEAGHFGICKKVEPDVWELKWANGRRVYYGYLAAYDILLLLGGNKNGQGKDIKQAKKALEKYAEIMEVEKRITNR